MPHTSFMRGSRLLLAVVVATCLVASATLAPAAGARQDRVDGPVIGLTVPWAIGGPRIEADGTLRNFPGEWPTIPFQSIRLWDTRTAWLNLEPRNDLWDFSRLDRFVAKARAKGVDDISLVLGGTPRWAAKQVRPTDAAWMGPGSASPPKRLSDWSDFVSKVAQRYRGLITSYEIWNEPNNVTFWSGSRPRWAQMVQVASEAIRSADPDVTVVASGFQMKRASDVAKVAPWLAALAHVRPAVDNVSFNWYPDKADDLAALGDVLEAISRLSSAAGIAGDPWVTELNVRRGASLSPGQQREAVATLTAAARRGGAARITWYAWTDLGPPDLMPLYPRTPAATAVGAASRNL